MAKELSLEELEKELQREQSKFKKLTELTLSLGFLTADGSTMTIKTPGGCIYSIVNENEKNEDEKNEEQESLKIHQEDPIFVTVEPTLFARAKKQFVDGAILPSIKKKADKVYSRIVELKAQIENLQQQQGTGLGE